MCVWGGMENGKTVVSEDEAKEDFSCKDTVTFVIQSYDNMIFRKNQKPLTRKLHIRHI